MTNQLPIEPCDSWSFDLTSDQPQYEKVTELPNENAIPFIDKQESWNQYTNPFVYDFDSRLRKFMEKMANEKSWKSVAKNRRYTYSMLIERLYGRKYDHKVDGRTAAVGSRIVAYYSSKIQKSGNINGKKYSKNIYTLSPKRISMPPYSLKLRMEWLDEKGELPSYNNMKLPNDNLKAGHARLARTEANMERRREDARRRYNEHYNKKRVR